MPDARQPAETFTEYQTQQEELRIRRIEAEAALLAAGGSPSPELRDAEGLWAALLKAQESFPAIVRAKTAKVPTKSGGEYSYDYADLGDILRAVGPVLRANGLVLVQPIVSTPDGAAIRSKLVHAPSGEQEVSDFPLPMDGAGAQQIGSLITYWRRYSAQAILGIVTESDSDARDVDVPRRQPRSSGGRSSAPRSGSQGSGAPTRTSPSVGVLMDELKLAVSTIETDGGRAEWDDWKSEKGWDRVWATSPEIRESKRPLIEEGLRVVTSIRVGEKARSGAEPWDPLLGAGDPGDPLPGQVPASELDTPDVGAADAAEDDVDPVTETDWESDGPYG